MKLRALAAELQSRFEPLHNSNFLALEFLVPSLYSSSERRGFLVRLSTFCQALPPHQLANSVTEAGPAFYLCIVEQKLVEALLVCLAHQFHKYGANRTLKMVQAFGIAGTREEALIQPAVDRAWSDLHWLANAHLRS